MLIDVDIKHSSLYRLIFRYVNPNVFTVNANIKITPMTSVDVEQTSSVAFLPAEPSNPQLVTVPGEGIVSTFVLNPGKWTISLKTDQKLYVVSRDISIGEERSLYNTRLSVRSLYNTCLSVRSLYNTCLFIPHCPSSL